LQATDRPATSAALVGSGIFLSTLAELVAAVPSGQVSSLARDVAGWVAAIDACGANRGAAALAVADLSTACLAHLPVTVTTAVAAAAAAKDIIAALRDPLRAAQAAAGGLGAQPEQHAALLMVYNGAVRLHRHCSLLHPAVHCLHGQEMQSPYNAPDGHAPRNFFASLDSDSEQSGDMLSFYRSPEYEALWTPSPTAPALQYATLVGAALRLDSLFHWQLHHVHATRRQQGEEEVQRGGDGQREASITVVQSEMTFLANTLVHALTKSQSGGLSAEEAAMEPAQAPAMWPLTKMSETTLPAAVLSLVCQQSVLQCIEGALPGETLTSVDAALLRMSTSGNDLAWTLEVPGLRDVLPDSVCSSMLAILR